MTLNDGHIDEICQLVQGHVLTRVPLSRFTSFKIGGPADLVVEPQNIEQLAAVISYLKERGIPRVFLGHGTNVLFHDAGFRGVVVRMHALRDFDVHTNGSGLGRISAAAGVPLSSVVSKACSLGWTGLEPLWGIPGSFGGAVVTNAGAGGVCIGDFLVRIALLSETGKETTLEKEQIRYGYRALDLPRGAVVVGGAVRLQHGEAASIESKLQNARSRRRASQPLGLASAGCVFKNPSPDNPAGAMLDRLGFKGAAIGGAQVSERHANFIINRGTATAADVLELIERVRERVRQEEQIELELEICVIGETADV